MTFGERIRVSRRNKNLTQKELAESIGAKHNSVSNWENNQNKPDPDMIELLCGILDVSPSYLMGYEEKNDTLTIETHLTKSEQDHMDKYRTIDEKGKHTVDTILEMEYNRCSYLMPVAAHDKGATLEQKKHADEIMDNDELWK